MGELILIQKGGLLNLNSKNPFRVVTKAEHKQALLSEDVLNISVESKSPIEFALGDKIEYAERYFVLNTAPKIKKEQGVYSYDLTFEGMQYTLRKKIYFNLDKVGLQTAADFALTGEIDIFLKVLINNINQVEGATWVLGEIPQNTETKTLTFNNENCLAVLQRICQEYNVEFEIIEDIGGNICTLNIKNIGNKLPYVFEYGKGGGLYSLSRENEVEDVVTRLYAYGSTENIPNNYRKYSERLRMPESQGDYLEDKEKIKLYGLKEGVKVFEDLRPSFRGVISSVGAFDEQTKTQEIEVSNIDFDLNEKKADGSTKYLIPDTPVKLHFNKGNLAGYEFEVMKNGGYNHTTKIFKIKQWKDDRGQVFPDPKSSAFVFNAGDEFTLLDIVMPEAYITDAENRLLEEAKKEYEKVSKNNLKYTLDIDPLFLKRKGDKHTIFFKIGDFIRLKDEAMNIDKESRIISITRDLLNPFQYLLDIADTYEISFTMSILNDIKKTKTEVKTQKEINRQNHLNGYRNLLELRENIFDTEGYFDATHIKPNSIETNMLSVGARNQNFVLENVSLTPNVNGNPNNISISSGKLVHLSLGDTPKEWNILPTNHIGLLDIVYYIYAKCEKNGGVGSWFITTEKLQYDSDANYYHFLCYILYTPKNGKREAEAMHGNVMLHGGQITAGRIKSLNGQTYFDLDTGEISGRISFIMPDGTTKNTNDFGSLAFKDKVEGAQLGETIVEGGFIRSDLINASAIVVAGGALTKVQMDADLEDIKQKTDNFTAIHGGLITSNVIQVGDKDGHHNAFVSGVTDEGEMSVRFGAGTNYANKKNAPFRVLDNGKMIASNVEITGEINASSGIFGDKTNNRYFEIFNDRHFGGLKSENGYILLGDVRGWDGESGAKFMQMTATSPATMISLYDTKSDGFNHTCLSLSAKNGNTNTALDIVAGDIKVAKKKGYTGNFSFMTPSSWGNRSKKCTVEITKGIITNVTTEL